MDYPNQFNICLLQKNYLSLSMSQTKRWLESIGYFDEDGNVKDDQLIADYIDWQYHQEKESILSSEPSVDLENKDQA